MPRKNKRYGLRFKNLRYEKDLTQGELAEKLGLSKPQISNLENGMREPSISELKAYSGFFSIPMEYLLNLSDSKDYQYTDVSKTLGLNDYTINALKAWQKNEPKCELVEVLNYIFESGHGYDLLEKMRRYFFAEPEQFIVYDDVYNANSNNPYDCKLSKSKQAFVKSESKELRAYSKNFNYDERIKLDDVQYIFQQSLYNVLTKIRETAHDTNKENTISKFEKENFEDGLINNKVNKNGKRTTKKK